jgi:hypothetical protein
MMVVEVDEHKHRGRAQACEDSRMFNVGQVVGGAPVMFLRINPDAYKSVGKNATLEERMQELVKEMDNIRDNWMPDVKNDTDELSMSWCMHMYYDGDDRTIKRVSPQ